MKKLLLGILLKHGAKMMKEHGSRFASVNQTYMEVNWNQRSYMELMDETFGIGACSLFSRKRA